MSRGETLKSASSGLTDLLSPPGCWPDASAAVTGQSVSKPMTHVIALDGQWEGLRAIPRTLRTPDHRKRLEDGLERIAGLYDAMATRAAMLTAGMARLDGLAAGMISQLDAIDGDADFEPYIPSPGGDDREFDTCDLGEPDVDS